jgi:hypothetical protein
MKKWRKDPSVKDFLDYFEAEYPKCQNGGAGTQDEHWVHPVPTSVLKLPTT